MKTNKLPIPILALMLFCFSGCEIVEGIFEAGVGVGMFIVIAVIILVVYLIFRFSGKK